MIALVLAEKTVDGETLYLTKWDGYPLLSSTWEPRSSFNQPDIMIDTDWKKRKETETPFNVVNFQFQLDAQEKASKKIERVAKQAKKAPSHRNSSYSDSSTEAEEIREQVDDDIGMKRKTKIPAQTTFKRQ